MNVQSPVTNQQANNNQPSGQTTLTSAYGGTDRHAQTHQFQTSMSLSAEQPHALTNVASHIDHRQTLTQSSQVAPQSSVPSSSDGRQNQTNDADAKMHSEQQVTSHVSNVCQSVNLPGAEHHHTAHQPTACQPTVYQPTAHQPTEHHHTGHQPAAHHHTGPQPAAVSQNAEHMLNERSGQDYQRSQRPSEIPIHTAPHGRVDSAMLPPVGSQMNGGGQFIQTNDSPFEQHPTQVGQNMMGAHNVISRRIPVPHAPTSPPTGDHTMPDTNPASVYVPQGPAPQSSTPCSTTDGNYSEHFDHATVPNLSTPQPFQSAHNNTPHSTVTHSKRPENLIKGGHSATNIAGGYETAGAYGSPHLAQKSKTVPLRNYEKTVSNSPRPNTSTHDVLSNVPYGQHQGASMVGQNPQPSMPHQFEIPQNMPQSQNVHYTTTSNPQAISDHNLQGQRTRYGGQHSFSSEDSMTSSPSANSFGTYSPQSSYGSHDQQSPPLVSKNNWLFNTPMDHQRHTFPRARPHPPHHSEMVAQQRRPIPSSAQQGSERVVSNPRAHTPSGTVHEFKNISTEQERQRYSGMGHYEPSPEISLHPSMYGHRFHHQDCVRPPYHRSNSATTHPNYPRTWSEPRNMDRHHGSFRRQQFVRQPRPGTWTAPVPPRPRFYCEDSDEVYYDDKHHYRYTEQHYPDQYFHQEQQHPHFAYSNAQQSYAWQPVGPDSRYADHYPGGGSDRMNRHHQEPPPDQCHTYRQISSRSNSVDSAGSIDTPNMKGSWSKPAETYYEEYINQNKEEFVKVLGESDHDEEYSVVLMQPQCVVDLSAPWAVIFAVCCRNPNCINALLEQLETKYSVDHISIVFDKNRQLMLDIPHEEARKQGYTILHSVDPIMITQSEASPPHKEFGAKADSIYPQRHHIWVHPQQIDNKTSCHLSLPLKLIGAKDCGKHFVLRSPQLMSPD